jgi:pimeloyl-ACP methyl ester carboxylesterase
LKAVLFLEEEIMKLRKKPFFICPVAVILCLTWLYAFLIVCHCEARQEAIDPEGRVLRPVTVTTKKDFPIIFLPGVAGTRLYAGYKELWPVPDMRTEYGRRYVKMLFMNEKGDPLEEVSPGDIIRHAHDWLPEVGPNVAVYNSFVESIQSKLYEDGQSKWSYKEKKNFFVWGYDWRLDNTGHLSALDKFVYQKMAETKSSKVILIGHSMGGLIARAYAVRHPQRVAMIISIGSPFAGSPKPFYGLVMGYTFGNTKVVPQDMKELFQNTPSVFQLLPQYHFVIDARSGSAKIPNREFYQKITYKKEGNESTWLTPWKWFASPSNRSMNIALLDRAKPFYDIVGTSLHPKRLDNNLKHYVVIGVGVRTLEGYDMRESQKSSLKYGDDIVMLEPRWGDGDGTVPVESANISEESAVKYFIHHKQGPDSSAVHGDLTNNKKVQEIVRSILLGHSDHADKKVPEASSKLHDSEPGSDFTLR